MSEIKVPSNELAFLSKKRVLLSNPGTKLDDIYYSALNTTVELSEVTWNTGRFKFSLTSAQFGATSQIIIPNSSLISEIYLQIVLPVLKADTCLPRGWGYALIDSISYLFGSSNVSQLTISGETHFMTIMHQIETAEKRSEFLRLAGAQKLTTTGTNEANIQLIFPWSSASGMFNKKPFDTNILDNPITIQIKFKSANQIIGGTGVKLTQFDNVTAFTRQGNLSNKDQSLKLAMLKDKSLIYSYPFIHVQTFNTSTLEVKNNGDTLQLNLLSFINADLLSIGIVFLKQSIGFPTNNDAVNPLFFQLIQSPILRFNGLVMNDTPGNLWRLVSMHSEIGADFFDNSLITGNSNLTFATLADKTYILMIDFSRIRSLSYEGKYQNVWRIGNNTLDLTVTFPLAGTYKPFISYYYNGIAEIQNGQTRIFFD